MASTMVVCGRRACTRSIHAPDRSARAARLISLASHPVSKRPIWLVEAARRSNPPRSTTARIAGSCARRLSMPFEFSPKAPIENSPLRCGSVASVSAWRLDVSEVCEVEIDDGLQGFAGGGLAEGVRQGVGRGNVVGLERDELGHRVAPTLRAGSTIRGLPMADDHGGLFGLTGAVAGLAFCVAERVVALLWVFRYGWSPLRNAVQAEQQTTWLSRHPWRRPSAADRGAWARHLGERWAAGPVAAGRRAGACGSWSPRCARRPRGAAAGPAARWR